VDGVQDDLKGENDMQNQSEFDQLFFTIRSYPAMYDSRVKAQRAENG